MSKTAVKLTSKNKLQNVSFYFHTIEDCESFKYVFKNHWCNVEWEPPAVVDYTPNDSYIDKDPCQRALDNLSWGFNSPWRSKNDGKITPEQFSVLERMVKVSTYNPGGK